MRRVGTMSALALALLAGGCGESEPLGPPPIHYGEDVCYACSMIISDERFAAAVVRREQGEWAAYTFDDVGCLLEFETEVGPETIASRYVKTFPDRAWTDMETAAFLHSPELKSPMAFGVAACSDRAGAERLAQDFPGTIIDLATVRERFARDELRQSPESGE